MAILTFLIFMLSNFLSDTLLFSAQYKTANEINHNARLVIKRISDEVRWAIGVNSSQSIFGHDDGRLVLETSAGEISFFLQEGVLYEQDNDLSPQPLTNSQVKVNKFSIMNYIFFLLSKLATNKIITFIAHTLDLKRKIFF